MNVLLAYDGRDESARALDEAARLAVEEGAAITVLSVVPKETRGTKSGGHIGQAPHAREWVAWAKEQLAQKGVAAETKVVFGDPADEIVREAESGYDLVVVGTRGLGPLAQHLLGSVSRRVAKRAPCPVLVAGAEGTRKLEPS